VSTVTDTYADFGAIGRAALAMVASRHGIELADDDAERILSTVKRLPPHPEVREALERLHGGGYRLATLTNSTAAVAQEQLDGAGLARLFEQILSADSARRLKPAREAYEMAAESLDVDLAEMRLVAAPRLGRRRRSPERLPGGVSRPSGHGSRSAGATPGHRRRRPRRDRRCARLTVASDRSRPGNYAHDGARHSALRAACSAARC